MTTCEYVASCDEPAIARVGIVALNKTPADAGSLRRCCAGHIAIHYEKGYLAGLWEAWRAGDSRHPEPYAVVVLPPEDTPAS